MNRKLLFSSIVAFASLGLAPKPYAATTPVVSTDDDASYAAGTQAMNERRWSDAVVSFDQVINAKGKKADAELYWKAYALNKLDKQELAADTCTQLRTQFKDSAWNEDCRALSLTIRVRTHAADRSDAAVQVIDLRGIERAGQKDPETEIKLLALNAVMRENPAQGIPLMRGILSGDQPASVKQQALFILAQNHSPEAQAMMHDLIVGKMGPELQYKAIQDSGIYRGKRSTEGKDSNDVLL